MQSLMRSAASVFPLKQDSTQLNLVLLLPLSIHFSNVSFCLPVTLQLFKHSSRVSLSHGGGVLGREGVLNESPNLCQLVFTHACKRRCTGSPAYSCVSTNERRCSSKKKKKKNTEKVKSNYTGLETTGLPWASALLHPHQGPYDFVFLFTDQPEAKVIKRYRKEAEKCPKKR